jgi:hypothetical protein
MHICGHRRNRAAYLLLACERNNKPADANTNFLNCVANASIAYQPFAVIQNFRASYSRCLSSLVIGRKMPFCRYYARYVVYCTSRRRGKVQNFV